MATRVLGPTGSRRRRRMLALVPLALLGALVLAIGASGAITDTAQFEGDDGNLVHGTYTDWNDFDPVDWQGSAPQRIGSSSFADWSFRGLEDWQATTADSAFAGGTKQDDSCANVGTGKAPNKDDLKRAYFAHKSVDVNGVDHVFLALAWVRIPQQTTSSSAHVGFEFNKGETACGAGHGGLVERTEGDRLVVYDFEGGSSAPVLKLLKWQTTGTCEASGKPATSAGCWVFEQNLTGAGNAVARVNTANALDKLPPGPDETLQSQEFGEALIDLTAAGVFTPGECESFGQAFAVSRSSGNSAQAQMKDLVGPGPVDIQNCGSIIIRKVTDPTPDATDTSFGFTAGGGLDPATFSLKDGEDQDYGSEVQAGSYTVVEDDPSPDFALTDIDCSASSLTNGSTVTENAAGDGVDIELAPQDTIDCTFTNTLQRGALVIEKRSTKTGTPLVSNDGAVFSIDSSSVTDNGTGDEDTTVGKVCVAGLSVGSHTVSETAPPDGYGDADASENGQSVTVVAGTNCSDNLPAAGATATFHNPPLADIQVNFRDGGSGETALSGAIDCDNSTGSDDTSAATGWDDSLTVSDIEAGASTVTVTCTIPIDP